MSRGGRDFGSRGGAEHLARIHGTEEDKVNCPFYFKIGACRHGDKCSRQHHRPPFSETVIIKHMWNNPMCAVVSAGGNFNHVDKQKLQEHLDEFYEEAFEELQKFGKIEDVQVCENLGDHMVGNVYVKYFDEEDSEKALLGLNGRFYAGRPLAVEYSPVTDFKEARCRQFDEGTCNRGPYCNFMHVCEPSRELRKHLETEYSFRGGRMKGTGGMDNIRNMTGGGGGGGAGRRDRGGGGRGGGGGGSRDRGGGGGGGGGDRRDRGGERERSRNRDHGDRDRDRERRRDRSGDRDRERDREHRRPDRDSSREKRRSAGAEEVPN